MRATQHTWPHLSGVKEAKLTPGVTRDRINHHPGYVSVPRTAVCLSSRCSVTQQAIVHIQQEQAIGIDMVVHQRRESPQIIGCHSFCPLWLIQHVLNQDRIDVDQAEWEQVQREDRQLLFLRTIRRDFATLFLSLAARKATPHAECIGAPHLHNLTASFSAGLRNWRFLRMC